MMKRCNKSGQWETAQLLVFYKIHYVCTIYAAVAIIGLLYIKVKM